MFNSHVEIFWKMVVLKKFADLKMSKYLRLLKNYCKRVSY